MFKYFNIQGHAILGIKDEYNLYSPQNTSIEITVQIAKTTINILNTIYINLNTGDFEQKKKKNLPRNVLKNIQVHLFYILYISNQAYSTIK